MAERFVTATWLCSKTGLSDRRHRQLANLGYFPPPLAGKYEAGPTLLGMIRYLTEQNQKKSDTLRKEQEALTKAKRESAQLDVAIKRGKLLDAAEVSTSIRNLCLNQRATLQRKFEGELAMNLMGLTDIERREKIRAGVDEYLAIMFEGAKQWLQKAPR